MRVVVLILFAASSSLSFYAALQQFRIAPTYRKKGFERVYSETVHKGTIFVVTGILMAICAAEKLREMLQVQILLNSP